MMKGRYKHTYVSAIINAIVASLCALIISYYFWNKTKNENTDFYVVCNSTKSKLEAIKNTDKLLRLGYNSSIYLTSNNYYAVVLGKCNKELAVQLKEQAVNEKIISRDSYITSKGMLSKLYPSKSDIENNRLNYSYIIAGSFSNKNNAINLASFLLKSGYDSKVYTSITGFYTVSLGYYEIEKAQLIMNNAIRKGHIGNDSFLSKGEDFITVIYSKK